MPMNPAQWISANPQYMNSFYPGGAGMAAFEQYMQANPAIETQTLQQLQANPQEGDYYENVLSTRLKEADLNQMNTDYGEFGKAIEGGREADLAEYMPLGYLAARKTLGGLNARGLGTSVMAGGQGTGALTSLADRFKKGAGDIGLGYDQLRDNAAAQQKSGSFNISDAYGNLDLARRRAKSNQADFFDFAAVPINAAKGLLA